MWGIPWGTAISMVVLCPLSQWHGLGSWSNCLGPRWVQPGLPQKVGRSPDRPIDHFSAHFSARQLPTGSVPGMFGLFFGSYPQRIRKSRPSGPVLLPGRESLAATAAHGAEPGQFFCESDVFKGPNMESTWINMNQHDNGMVTLHPILAHEICGCSSGIQVGMMSPTKDGSRGWASRL